MARPTRHPNTQSVRMVAFVHPDTATAIREKAAGMPLGQFIDEMVGAVPPPPPRVARKPDEPPYKVYQLLQAGEIVYVGKAAELTDRLKKHRADKTWDAVSVSAMPDEASALLLETRLIERFQPKYNKIGIRKSAETAPVRREHVKVPSGTFGWVCKACKKPKKTAEGTNCVPIDENPPEEAHLTQKGPK